MLTFKTELEDWKVLTQSQVSCVSVLNSALTSIQWAGYLDASSPAL